MWRYILKRLLIMVPTFLFITIIVFVMINIAPGEPGQSANASGVETADQSTTSREGYRLFKEQYHLDLPILLNFRFLLDNKDVAEELEILAHNMNFTFEGEQENTQRPAQKNVFEAEENIENWGQVIVPSLLTIAEEYVFLQTSDGGIGTLTRNLDGENETEQTATFQGNNYFIDSFMTQKVRFLAVQRLSVNARQTITSNEGVILSEEQLAENRLIFAENNTLSQWTYSLNASLDEQNEVLSLWKTWFDQNNSRFQKTISSVFFNTRFAHYWANLSPVGFHPLQFKKPNLGSSFRYRRPVFEVIGEHWRYSIYLSLISLLLAYFISIPIGVLAAVKQNQFADRGIGAILFVLYSLPSFFVGTLLATFLTGAKSIHIFGISLDLAWFPVAGFRSTDSLLVTTFEGGFDVLWHLVLPVFCLTYGALAVLSRYARTGLLEVIRSDYIRTARAKGLSEWVVIMKHAVRNGMIPILTLLGTTLPYLIGGSIVIEYIFAIDGMGRLMLDAISYRDYNIIMGILLISSIFTLLGILLSDISYALVDPRISFE